MQVIFEEDIIDKIEDTLNYGYQAYIVMSDRRLNGQRLVYVTYYSLWDQFEGINQFN